MGQVDEDALRWRQQEGARRRSLKDHEDAPDPDWSLPEISRDADDLATEFYDWWNANRMDGDTVEVAFAAWATERWKVELDTVASGIIRARIRAFRKGHAAKPTIVVPPRREGESAEDYVRRIAVENKLIAADPPKGPDEWKQIAAPAKALPPIPETYRAPYKDDPDDGTGGQDRESYSDEQDRDSYTVPVCVTCKGELGPLDTTYCSDACAAQMGGSE